MNLKAIKSFTLGCIITAVVLGTCSVFAESVQKMLPVSYENIKIYIDGNLLQPKDADGNPVEPFIYNGTIYVPIRAISEAFGKPVKWDGSKASVYIGEEKIQNASLELYIWKNSSVTNNDNIYYTLLPVTNRIKYEKEIYDPSSFVDYGNLKKMLNQYADNVNLIIMTGDNVSKNDLSEFNKYISVKPNAHFSKWRSAKDN